MTMPSKGDKVYRIASVNCTKDESFGSYVVESATFLEEQILEGASRPTWTCRDNQTGQKFICSPDMYVTTKKEAWERQYKDFLACIPTYEDSVKEAIERLRWLDRTIFEARQAIKDLQ